MTQPLGKLNRTLTAPALEWSRIFSNYQWLKVHQRCFDVVKVALVNADTLAHPDFSKPFLVLTDHDTPTNFFVAALVPVQLDDDGSPRPVAYASTLVEAAARRYGASDLECACVIWCIRLWRVYLHGAKHKTVVVTDQRRLSTHCSHVP